MGARAPPAAATGKLDPEGGLPGCREAREQTGRSADSPRLRGPRRRRGAPAGTAAFKSLAEGLPPAARKMRLHCEVEVVSRRLPALGLRNPGKGVRALLSLCQPAPRSPPRPPAGRAGAPRPACLLVSTLKDKRGTRYEVRGASRPFPGAPRVPGAAPGPRRRALGGRPRLFSCSFCDFEFTGVVQFGGRVK